MKNFRKVLALILVVATLFSLTAMISAKSTEDYTDGEKINYVEAVDVLSAIGILEGYTDNSFQPTKNIQREEMAKMVAVLSNAGDDVEDLYASACSFADSKNSWAASYIAYCTQVGIVAGRSASIFDPDANVTGLETAKMLLCVLGFDATEQGYVGSNWKVNVLRDAKNFGLLNGFEDGYDVSKAITREEAAQMFLNALQANIVIGTISNNIVSISNASYRDASNNRDNWTLKDADKFGERWVQVYGNVVISDKPLASIYKGLSLDEDQDCYGNPGYTWNYENSKGASLFSKFYASAPDLKYTTTASLAKDLTSEIKSTKDYRVDLYVDGELILDNVDLSEAVDKNGNPNLDEVEELTGKGVLTQVFVDDVDTKVTITIKYTYIGEVDYITKQANTFTLATKDGKGLTFSNKEYDFEPGDIILYWICNGGKDQHKNPDDYKATLHDAKIAEPVSVEVTRTTTKGGNPADSTVTASGETYEYARNFAVEAENYSYSYGWDEFNAQPLNEWTGVYDSYYNLYLDEYGYIMLYRYDDYVYDLEYYYVVEGSGYATYTGSNGYGDDQWSCTADLVDFDGKFSNDAAVTKPVYDESVKTTNKNGYGYYDVPNGTLVETYDYNGIKYLNYVYDEDGNAIPRVAEFASVDATLTKNGNITNENSDGHAKTLYGTEKTRYLVRTWDYDKGEYVYTGFTGRLDKSYLGYVYNWFDGDYSGYWDKDANGNPVWVKGPVKIATIQYFTDDEGFLTYVFVDALYTDVSQRAFVTGYRESISDIKFLWEITAVNAYNAVINGEESVLLLTHEESPLNEFPFLYESKLQVIGLTDNGLPVYSDVDLDGIDPRTDYQAYRWYEGILQVVEPGKEGNVYRIAEDAVAVVTVQTTNGLDTKVLESVEDINDYFESLKSLHGQVDDNGDPDKYNYIPVNGWIVTDPTDDEIVTELYIVVQ